MASSGRLLKKSEQNESARVRRNRSRGGGRVGGFYFEKRVVTVSTRGEGFRFVAQIQGERDGSSDSLGYLRETTTGETSNLGPPRRPFFHPPSQPASRTKPSESNSVSRDPFAEITPCCVDELSSGGSARYPLWWRWRWRKPKKVEVITLCPCSHPSVRIVST